MEIRNLIPLEMLFREGLKKNHLIGIVQVGWVGGALEGSFSN
jgi:hypothetical protein